jgi:SPP1 gp7 family putative phage head morphogenesis protein
MSKTTRGNNHAGCYAENLTLENDPTRTLEVRQNFLQDIRGRFRRVNGAIRRTIGPQTDAFGLNKIDAAGPYNFPTDRQKINEFIEDLKAWLREEILEPANFSELRQGEHWTSAYVASSYVIGRNVAVRRLRQEGISADEWALDELTQTRTSLESLRQLYSRTYENLRDISEDTADVIREELTKGFAQGESPTKIARRITKEVKTIQRTRAETLARTEVINTATDATLDEYQSHGVDTVGHGEWMTAHDNDVCAFCRRLNNEKFKISEVRGDTAVLFRGQTYRLGFPAHPSGRCVPTPVVGFTGELEPLEERVPGEIVG